MKKIIFVFLLIGCVSASNDAFLTIDSKDAGLCLGLDTPQTQFCQNDTLIIDGTADHVLYILPESEIDDTTNSTKIARYAFFQPIGIVVSAFGYVMLLIGLFAAVMFMLGGAFNRFHKYKKNRR